MKKLLLALCFVILIPAFSWANHEGCTRSTEGTEFWFGFMEGRNDNVVDHRLTITVTSAYTTYFSIYNQGGTNLLGTYSVSANSEQLVEIPWETNEVMTSESVGNKGIYLVANDPVNVYAMNWDYKSSDAAVIYPVESIGKEYFTLCYEPHYNSYGTGLNGRNSEFLIVATEDQTQVTITPSKITDGLKPANVPFVITLNKGQTYQVQSANEPDLDGQGDLTGSHVVADKNIAVYSGNFGTTVPRTSDNLADPELISGYDHLFEQMPPLYSWGTEYYAVPLMGRELDFYRIIASEDGTTVDAGPFWAPFVLNRGEFKEIYLESGQASRIAADKPILVAQYSASQNYLGEGGTEYGDPSMIVLSSTAQSKNNVTFVAYDSENITSYHINIVSLTDQASNLRLDGNPVSTKPFAGTAYSYAQILLSASGSHTLLNTDPDEGFLAYVYGQGDKESYGYPVGFNLNVVLDLGENINFDGDTLLLCPGDELTLDAGPYFETYLWSTGETSSSIRVSGEGMYKVTTTISDCPALHDSVYVFYAKPQLEITPADLSYCFPKELSLVANSSEATSFLWESKEGKELGTTSTLTVDSTAQYIVTVWNEYGCSTTDTADVIIFGRPPVTIAADSLVCGELQTAVTADLGNYPDSLWTTAPGTFEWASDDAGVSFADPTDSSVTMLAPGWGTYQLYYKLTTKNGCISGDTIEVTFSPGTEFTVEPDQFYRCAPDSVELKAIISSGSADVASYLWQTSSGDTLAHTETFWADSTAQYILSIENSYACTVTDTAEVIIFGNPPVTIHSEPAACDELSTTVHVDFASYPPDLWDYPGSFQWFAPSPYLTVSDSTDASATVKATAPGVYELYYKLTTKDNCVSGDTIELSFIAGPEFSIVSDTYSKCAPDSVLLTADVRSDLSELVSYLWQTAQGDSIAFGAVPEIWVDSTASYVLTIENTDGCRASDTAEVVIFGNPPVSIQADPAVCGELTTNVHVDFAGYSPALWDYPGSFQWLAASPDLTVSESTDASATVKATVPGIYDLYYKLTTKDDCVSGDTIQLEFYPQPQAAFGFNFQPTCRAYVETLRFTGTTNDLESLNWTFRNAAITDTIAEGEYLVRVFDFAGVKPAIELIVDEGYCKDTAYQEEPDFSAERALNIDFKAEPPAGCDSLETMLIVTNIKEESRISWFTDLGSFSGDSLALTYTVPGAYDVTMLAESDLTGCLEMLTKEGLVQVVDPPVAAFSVDYPVVSPQNPLVTFYNNSTDADAYNWIFGDGDSSMDYAPQHEYPAVGSYIAWLIARSDLGCSDSTTTQIQVVVDRIYAPNAFRPGSDIVENTVFMPAGLGDNGMPFLLRIYDRWGQLVFESTTSASPWDGTDKSGKEAPMGNYVWMATFVDLTGKKHEQTGQILLIR
ncbi:gliding motility-associated C-terminal domain-containing protein [Mangrovibacterium marinum]|uniref:CHU domain-containing protein n=1 Tax=Mangrovibacterium marinum TaxID=1639118 RepID=A0A2T5C2H4_9BACT|nr:gliding motility-associated C-terminal domain-containing protein [Mangrovibacterium marinum]PTN08943.1 CHU domain-containing protein [Mangrovibacterium marinum]